MKSSVSSFLLLLTSFIWGFAFVAQSQVTSLLGPFIYNGIRMILGAIVLLPLFIPLIKKRDKKYIKSLLIDSLICGLLLALASNLQQEGITYTSAGKAGFITSLYILLVPVISLLMGKKSSTKTWICVLTGLVGAFLLSISSTETINKGDAIVFLSSIVFSLHIIAIDKLGKKYNGIELSTLQFFFAGLSSLIVSFFFERTTLDAILSCAWPIIYGGVFSCGIAYTLQVVGQKYTSPTKATLLLSLESVFSALGGALLLSERMSEKEIIGASILFLSVLIAQLPDKKKKN